MFKYRIRTETVTYPPFSKMSPQTFYTVERSRCGIRWEIVWDTVHQDQAVSRVRGWQKEQRQSGWETVDIQEEPA